MNTLDSTKLGAGSTSATLLDGPTAERVDLGIDYQKTVDLQKEPDKAMDVRVPGEPFRQVILRYTAAIAWHVLGRRRLLRRLARDHR